MVQLHNTATCFITVSRQKSWGSGQDRNYNPYKPNLLRSKSLSPAHSQKEELHKGMKARRKGSLETISEASYPGCLLQQLAYPITLSLMEQFASLVLLSILNIFA